MVQRDPGPRRDARGQSRTLHIEQALACIDWSAGPVHPLRAEGYPESSGAPAATDPVRQHLVGCRYFTLNYQRQATPFPCGGSGSVQVLLVLHGQGTLEAGDGQQELRAGDTLVLPAAAPAALCRPQGPLGILFASLPHAESNA